MKKLLLFVLLFYSLNALSQQTNVTIGDKTVQLAMGTKVELIADFENDKLREVKLLDEQKSKPTKSLLQLLSSDSKEKNFTLEFTILEMGKRKTPVLVVKNPYDKRLIYKAKIQKKGATDFVETSIAPVVPSIASIEQWNEDLQNIILYDFELLNN
ncbi:MAG: hypothetical protein LPK19_07700 [Hymenobacteraceae bacterium]|nr:hypothetical protein [Hymenobacteraceae bacterium]MDX5396092.1 hypothetical protein [Hymenobacteraceae bacterium]MDX5512157.1 hypothetical protein [Hymenobacteraceae bacterium]